MSKGIQFARFSFIILSVLFVICIVVQIFLAGLSIFVSPAHWANHISFIHLFEFLPILMLIFSFLGKMPVNARWLCAGLFGVIFIMYFTANFGSVSPWVAATHPVIAFFLFWLSIKVTQLGVKTLKIEQN